jgi:hypothetical protein
LEDLFNYLNDWFRVKIIDNGDGTWTAEEFKPGFIQFYGDMEFRIVNIDAVYLDEFTFVISDTVGIVSNVSVDVHDNGDGTFTISSPHENIIIPLGGDLVEVRNATISIINSTTYFLSETVDE